MLVSQLETHMHDTIIDGENLTFGKAKDIPGSWVRSQMSCLQRLCTMPSYPFVPVQLPLIPCTQSKPLHSLSTPQSSIRPPRHPPSLVHILSSAHKMRLSLIHLRTVAARPTNPPLPGWHAHNPNYSMSPSNPNSGLERGRTIRRANPLNCL